MPGRFAHPVHSDQIKILAHQRDTSPLQIVKAAKAPLHSGLDAPLVHTIRRARARAPCVGTPRTSRDLYPLVAAAARRCCTLPPFLPHCSSQLARRLHSRAVEQSTNWHEDPVRRVRGRGGHSGVLRRRGRAVRALRRRDPRRQQARQQAPAPPARHRAPRRPPALRRLPGEAGLHLLRGGQGALLPRLRRPHPRPRHALRQPPALPHRRHPRRLRLRLHRPRRPPPAQAASRPRRRRGPQAGPGRRAGGAVVAVHGAVGLGRRGPLEALGLRLQRQEGVSSWVQGAGVARGHRPVP